MKAWTRNVATSLLVISLAAPAAPTRAEMLAAADVILKSDRDRIAALLAREEIREQLLAHGLDATQVSARVAALTDAEAALLAAEMDKLPAGGRAEALVGIVLFVMFLPVVLVVGAVALVVKAIASAPR